MSNYDYGSYANYNITLTGAMAEHYGSYANLNGSDQYLLQCICHMVFQIKNEVAQMPSQILRLDGVWLLMLERTTSFGLDFHLFTNDYMTVFHVIYTGGYDFEFEFFSPNQFKKTNSFLDYVYDHVEKYGRNTQ